MKGRNENDQLLKISATLELQWTDEFLTWNTTEYPGITTLYVPIAKIWLPDVYLFERVQSDDSDNTRPLISPDGKVLWSFQTYLTTSCKINPRFFPFDTHKCTLTFGSWSYDHTKMDIHIRLNRPPRLFYTDTGVWNLTAVHMRRYNKIVDGYVGEYPHIEVSLMLTRRSLFYVLVIIVPSTLLSLVSLMVFILPAESGEKVSLGITNFLALVLVQQLTGEFMPPASDQFPIIISYYFTPMIVTGCLSVISGVITAYFQYQHLSNDDVPTWLLKIHQIIVPKKRSRNEHDILQTNEPNQNDISVKLANELKEGDENDAEQEGDTIDNAGDNEDHANLNGKDVALMVNRCLMVVCLLITLMSTIITVSLFAIEE
ncbi:neuronal acetylcholine receptor subunit alpha-7-like [Amphiura filiformis]|uniref:neuronal acetylcholine receptor subunit alpha-7-like n=1 Tax=Amphiura filiformis TaxID=82378 RepID=UPI003B21E9F3